ncbi:MAG: hypothetical protein UR26_C0004G0061 [candidate division TM6 bacterium GW2011_GWF2_32_72]|nr:MAG: hypothetical protein UR26_C0004G0061 [candidate division TM6 bacterium GW2011_GWF2_32_72]
MNKTAILFANLVVMLFGTRTLDGQVGCLSAKKNTYKVYEYVNCTCECNKHPRDPKKDLCVACRHGHSVQPLIIIEAKNKTQKAK